MKSDWKPGDISPKYKTNIAAIFPQKPFDWNLASKEEKTDDSDRTDRSD